jgi:F-type H+-transporting ATPase subunit gamma
MASIKELRLRIGSLKNTNKITAAMKLVASSKLKKSQDAMQENRPYSEKLTEVLGRVSGNSESENPLLVEREVKKVRLYVYSSEKGLCGSFNNSIIKFVNREVLPQFKNVEIEIQTIGRKVKDFFSKRSEFNFVGDHGELTKLPNFKEIHPVAQQAMDDFKSGKIDAAYLVFNKFESILSQVATLQQVLPIPKSSEEETGGGTNYLYEPDQDGLLDALLPKHVAIQYYQGLLENSAGEHGARMNAMENATKNSKELIDKLTLVMNRARQAAITTELTEIVSGAESLKD